MEYEDRLTISTPEGVDLELTLAGLGSRFVAGAVDLTLKLALIGALALVMFAIAGAGGGLAAVAVFSATSFAIWFGYDVAFEVLGGGRTLGKRGSGLRVQTETGGAIGLRASVVRNLVRVVEGPLTLYAVGALSILVSRRGQRLGDHAAGTVVVRERRAADRLAAWSELPAVDRASGAFDVSTVTVEELATVRRFLDRRHSLERSARESLAAELAERLHPKVVGAPAAAGAEPFLEWLAGAKASRG